MSVAVADAAVVVTDTGLVHMYQPTTRNAPPLRCRACKRRIAADARAVLVDGPLHAECYENARDRRGWPKYFHPATEPAELSCARCGRPMLAHGNRRFCPPCAHEATLERRRLRRQAADGVSEPRQIACAACGETFRSARRESRYCSDACRQKAYRRRRAMPRKRTDLTGSDGRTQREEETT